MSLRFTEFRPLKLTVDQLGTFREPEAVDFTNGKGEPCNYFLLLSQNGQGKTTLLKAFYYLIELLRLADDDEPEFPKPEWLVDHPNARMQLDLRVGIEDASQDGKPEQTTVVLSIIAGAGPNPGFEGWSDARLAAAKATKWLRFGTVWERARHFDWIGEKEPLTRRLRIALKIARGRATIDKESAKPALDTPTVLFFSASRDVLRPPQGDVLAAIGETTFWGYDIARRFERTGAVWPESLDALFVWLYWLDDGQGRFERARQLVNDHVFIPGPKRLVDISKNPPGARINNRGSKHRLDQLSSGERNLVQLFVRIGVNMTRNTILIIDEQDVHLHPKWRHKVTRVLKEMAQEHPGLTIIATSHSRETRATFAFAVEEPRLRKGGIILDHNFDEASE